MDASPSPSPLYVAANGGRTSYVEALVGYGATDERGRTILHNVLNLRKMEPLSEWTVHLNEVRVAVNYRDYIIFCRACIHSNSPQFHEYVLGADNSIQDVPVYITVACFLVSEGASLETKTQDSGITPLDLCLPEYHSLLKLFARPER